MDDNSALAQEYLCTIESMQSEVNSLKAQLAEYPESEDAEERPEDLKESLESSHQEIEDLYSSLSEATSRISDLKAEEEWVTKKFPL